MRIALAADGTRGDVHPLLELGVRAIAAGHDVLLCAPPDFADDAAARGVPFRPVGEPVQRWLGGLSHTVGAGARATVVEGGRYVREAIGAQFAALPDAFAGADRVVAASLAVAAASAAELHGIPYRFVAYCPTLLPSAEHPLTVVSTQTWPRWVNRASWRLGLPLIDAMVRRELDTHRRRLGLPRLERAFPHLLGRQPVLAADRSLAPLPADVAGPVGQIPALQALERGALPLKLSSFLLAGPPPVYVGFGSMPDGDPAATTRLVLEALERLGARGVLGSGWAGLGEGALPDSVMSVGSVSHAALFARCAVVVHHGGAGTTTTAARAGVPQLVVPHLVDQGYWGRRVERLGLGPAPIPRRRLTAERLADALRSLLDNEIVEERARELGTALRREARAVDPVASILG